MIYFPSEHEKVVYISRKNYKGLFAAGFVTRRSR